MRRTGFTLLELLTVVVILAILASIALPNYTRAIERQRREAAQNVLLTIFVGEQAYYGTGQPNNNSYKALTTSSDWTAIFMVNPNISPLGQVVTFDVVGTPLLTPPFSGFTATAKRTGGLCDTKILTIDKSSSLSGDWLGCPP